MWTSNKIRLLRVSQLPFILCIFCLVPFVLLSSTTHSSATLPPSLKQLVRNSPRVTYPPSENPPEWKRPLTFTLVAQIEAKSVLLKLFTTGVDIGEVGQSYNTVGCLVGTRALLAEKLQPALITCRIQRELLEEGIPITVAIEYDESVARAMNSTLSVAGEKFSFEEGDVTVLNETPPEFAKHVARVAAIRTLVTWNEAYIDASTGVRHELCVMTAMRQYPYLLKDWIAFYRRMGVDKIYIYENWATTDLDRLVGSEFVEIVPWPWVRSQMQSNNHFLLASKNRCKYVAFFDADEFVMIGGGVENGMLKKYITRRDSEGYSQVVFHFLMMFNNGFVRRPRGALPELYTRRQKDQVLRLGKAAINTDVGWDFHKIHMVSGGGKVYWNTTMELNPTTTAHNAMLVHYTKRSWEEYVLKNRIGGASVMTNGRTKRVLDIDMPDEGYMSKSDTVEFGHFREMWRAVMKVSDDGHMTLIERESGTICRLKWCPRCWWKNSRKECV